MRICKECGTRIAEGIDACPQCNSHKLIDIIDDNGNDSSAGGSANVSDNTKQHSASGIAEYTPGGNVDKVDKSSDGDNSELEPVDENAANEEYNYEKPSVNKKTVAIIIGSVAGAVAVIVGVICLFTLVDFNVNLAYDTDEITFIADEDVTGEVLPAAVFVADTPYAMTDKFSDYQIKINEIVYQVPMSVKAITDSGWAFGYGEDSSKTLGPAETSETFFVSKDGAIMYATVYNFYDEEAMMNECHVSRIKIDFADNEGIAISIVNDLALGTASKSGVEQAAGDSSDEIIANGRAVVTYRISDAKYARFVFEENTEALVSVEYINNNRPNDFADKAEQTTAASDVNPVADGEMSNDVMSGYVEFEGDVYRLPILVSDLEDKGWDVSFDEDRWLVYPDEHLYVTLTRDGKVISRIDVYNSSTEEKGYPNCHVVSLDVSVDDDYSIVWPNNIKPGMSEADLVNALGNTEYELNTTHFNEYSILKDEYLFIATVDKDEKTVNSVSMYYDDNN